MTRRWYAVQETREDAWDRGSYDYDDAVRMLREQGHGLIAVIDESEQENFCLEEIQYEDTADAWKVRSDLDNNTLDELGPMVSDDIRWSPAMVREDAENFGMTPAEFIGKYLEEVAC